MSRSVESTMNNEKKRYPFLSIWLTLIIIYSVTCIILYFAGQGVSLPGSSPPEWATPVLTVLLILQTICVIALFHWKKWGFWGYCVINIIGLIVDILIDVNIVWPSITVLIGIACLYGALHVGQENKGWPQLD